MRILVLTGSRAFDVGPRARFWARRALGRAFAAFDPDMIAHGGARGWDTEGDNLAKWQGLPRIVFDLRAGRPELHLPSGGIRPLFSADRYTYDGPLPRNDVMMRWAADVAGGGYTVKVVASVAPWANTRGTRHAMAAAKLLGLPVEEIPVPQNAWEQDERGGLHP